MYLVLPKLHKGVSIIYDSKARRRKFLMRQEINRDCLKFETECKDLGTHRITPEEIQDYNNKLYRASAKYSLLTQLQKGVRT